MRQFFNANQAALANLEQRTTRACVVFRDQEMPKGAMPARSRIGFEKDTDTGVVRLLVDRGISYSGPSEEIGAWLRSGEMEFAGFNELAHWIKHSLQPCYTGTAPIHPVGVGNQGQSINCRNSTSQPAAPMQATPGQSASVPRQAVSVHSLTDWGEVRENLPQHAAPIFIEEHSLRTNLTERVRGQDVALATLSRRVARHLARRQPRRPATLFAVGPTGVGKTHTAIELSQALRASSPASNDYSMLRLDMAEYQERHRVSQLLGAPPGYVGFDQGAQLVDFLAANPRALVLYDEIEKAHPDILKALMNAIDAGRISRVAGRSHGDSGANHEVDCRLAFFLFTSNLCADGILQDLERDSAFDNPVQVDLTCRRYLRGAGIAPELIGRIETFLVYRPLSMESRAQILTLSIARAASEYGLNIVRIEPSVITTILHQARSHDWGARPDEYLLDEMLGEAFIDAAATSHSVPLILQGPPFACNPFTNNVEGGSERPHSDPLTRVPARTR